jgi:hypothetical protein
MSLASHASYLCIVYRLFLFDCDFKVAPITVRLNCMHMQRCTEITQYCIKQGIIAIYDVVDLVNRGGKRSAKTGLVKTGCHEVSLQINKRREICNFPVSRQHI